MEIGPQRFGKTTVAARFRLIFRAFLDHDPQSCYLSGAIHAAVLPEKQARNRNNRTLEGGSFQTS
jgi:hypothetical protein